MKKLLALLLCVLLLGVAPAVAEDHAELPLFRVAVRDAAGQETTIGSGVLFNGALFTTAPVVYLGVEGLVVYGPDGSAYGVTGTFSSSSGYAYLDLDREAENAREADWSFDEPTDGLLVGLTANGRRYEEPVKGMAAVQYKGVNAYLVSADEPLLPGAMLVDRQNDVIGAVMAAWGEGENRYVAVSLENMLLMDLMFMRQEPEAEADVDWLTGVTLGYQEGVLTVDWSGSEIDGLDEESRFIVYVADQGNDGIYYSYFLMDADEGSGMSRDVCLAPGRSYDIWVSHVHDEADEAILPPAGYAVTFTMPDEGMLTDYGFTDDCYIGWTPDWEDPNEAVSLMETPGALIELRAHGEPFYLRVVNTYHVEEDIERPLVIALQTPEGYLFTIVEAYIFSPEYEENDVWSVEINELFDQYIEFGRDPYMDGEYMVRYAIGGVWAGECSFTIE